MFHSPEEEKERAKRSIIDLYKQLRTFLKSEKYKKNFKYELELSKSDFVGSINKRIEDMEKTDHGIVITGETSAGKSTLINKILGKIIFIGTTTESTSTICKIRNLERVRIITENMKGEIEETDLTGTCDIQSQSGEEYLRTALTELTSENFEELKYVDVGFPIPFLQGKTILVDTPGIGGAVEFTKKLMEYLPNALSFIFVISVERAGGMQDDRLPALLESIKKLRNENKMPCFDPENVIFITNKWDSIRSQLDVEKEKEKVWENIKKDIKRKWEFVKEEHIFRMNCLDVRKSVLEETEQIIEDTAKNCYENMLDESVKRAILNPPGRLEMMQVTWLPSQFVDEINTRITEYVNHHLQSGQVLQRFEDVKNEIITFYNEVSTDLSAMENQLTNVVKYKSFGEKYRREEPADLDDLPLEIKIPVVAVSVLAIAIAIITSPVLIPTLLILSRDERKRKLIDEVYNKYTAKIPDEIQKHLKKNCGDPLHDLVEKIKNGLLPPRIIFLEHMIKTTSQTREKILMDINSLKELKEKVDAMKKSAAEIQVALNGVQF